ncbi:MAG: hypothetical protein JWN37_726 [Candidatus Nomurabacteria bacterium]|nr:hypothetical protein [Candidatus Nomurabacteria bacterium]
MNIVQGFRHLLIPHEHNDYKPHIFRELSVAIILFVSIFLLGASAGSSFFINKTVKGASIAASVLVDLANDNRLAYNEEPLTINPLLVQAATLKGQDMAKEGYFAHESPSGVTPWHWFDTVGYKFLYAGENLAINYTDSTEVDTAWMNSPGHRANLLNVNFREVGIATIEGVYNNYPTIFVVQMFGTPAKASATSVKAAPSTQPATTTPEVVAPVNTSSTIKESTSTTTTNGTTTGEIRGESITAKPALEEIVTNKELAVVRNNEALEEASSSDVTPPEAASVRVRYSNWYDHLLLDGSGYIDTIYKIIIAIVGVALVTTVLVEYRKQHYKHLLYGMALLVILTIFVYINQLFF